MACFVGSVGRTIDKEVVLLDFGGMSLSLLSLKSMFSTMNKIGSSYFPERTVLFFILNAPGIFAKMWTLVCVWHLLTLLQRMQPRH